MKKLLLLVLMSTVFFYSHAGTKAVASEQVTAETNQLIATVGAQHAGMDEIKFWDCTIVAKLTYTDKHGNKQTISVELTIKDVSCDELLKKVLTK